LIVGVELGSDSLRVSRALLQHGFIALPAGMNAEVLSLTPPCTLTPSQILAFLQALDTILAERP